MLVANKKIIEGLEFEDYLKLPGLSHSILKSEGKIIEATAKMKFGTRVDQYLFSPSAYDGIDLNLVRPVAMCVKGFLGSAMRFIKTQVSLTADFIHEGLVMQYKGRPDMMISDMIIDLKVSQLDTIKSIEYFRYDRQVSGYAAAAGKKNAIIISINPVTKKITAVPIKLTFDWWEYQIKRYGEPLQNLQTAPAE